MEKALLLALLILLSNLSISFVIFIIDYSAFKKKIEKILDSNIEINNDTKEVINITKKVNISVGQICELNSKLITNIYPLLKDNNLINKIEDKEETNEE